MRYRIHLVCLLMCVPIAGAVFAESESLAIAIDPGEVPPLYRMDSPLLDELTPLGADLSATRESLLAEADRLLGLTPEDRFALFDFGSAEEYLRMVLALERELDYRPEAPVELLARLERFYAGLGSPHAHDMFSRGFLVDLCAAAAADDCRKLMHGFQAVIRRCQDRQMRTAATLLRLAPDHPSIPGALRHSAASMTAEATLGTATTLYREAVRRAGANAGVAEWSDLARVCYRTLDVQCGDEALAQARGLATKAAVDKETAGSLDALDGMAQSARQALAVEGAVGLEAGLQRAGAYAELERGAMAQQLYERLRGEFPTDARPVVGLGWLAWSESMMTADAVRPFVAAALPLENRDRDFYELAIGLGVLDGLTAAARFVSAPSTDEAKAALASAIASLRSLLPDYARYRPALSQVIALKLECVEMGIGAGSMGDNPEALLASIANSILDRAGKLRKEHPDEATTHLLALSAASLTSNAEVGFAEALAAVPDPSSRQDEVALLRARTLFKLVLVNRRDDLLPRVREFAEAVPRDGERANQAAMLRGVLHAIEARRTGDVAAWREAARLFEEVLADLEGEQHARAANNLGVALSELGDNGAAGMWRLAVGSMKSPGIPHINLVVGTDRPADEKLPELRRIVDTPGVDKDAVRVATEWVKHLESEPVDIELLDRWGVALGNSLTVNPGFRQRGERLLFNIDSHAEGWLYLPVPAVVEE